MTLRSRTLATALCGALLASSILPAQAGMTYPPAAATQAATLPPGVVTHPGYGNNAWYVPYGGSNTTASTTSPAIGTAYCSMIGVAAAKKLANLSINITTAGSTNFQLAIYGDDASVAPHRPGALIVSTADNGNTATGNPTPAAVADLAAGWYWVCLQTNDTAMRYRGRVGNQNDATPGLYMGSSSASVIAGTYAGVSTASGITAYGTWPATFVGAGATWTDIGNQAPAVSMKFSQ